MFSRNLLLVVLLATLLPFQIQAQLVADAGVDTIYCNDWEAVLGGVPSAHGGVPPYSYTWSATIDNGFSLYHASIVLDDTTAANPSISSGFDSVQWFYLEVRDSLGAVARDSVGIGVRNIACVTADCAWTIDPGDIVHLWLGCQSNYYSQPIDVVWTPPVSLGPPGPSPPVSPTMTTTYSAQYFDDAGCPLSWSCTVHVNATGIEEDNGSDRFRIHPNPIRGKGLLHMPVHTGPTHALWISAQGRIVREMQVAGSPSVIDASGLAPGLYTVVIRGNGELGRVRVIVQ